MEMISSVPVAQQAMVIIMKLCVVLCMPQNAPECTSEHLKLPKFPGEACPQTPRVNDCRAAMFSTSANDIAPPDGKSYARPCRCHLDVLHVLFQVIHLLSSQVCTKWYFSQCHVTVPKIWEYHSSNRQ